MSREPDREEFYRSMEPEPKWPLNLQGLIAWLETQDPDTKYNWQDVYHCLVARFLISSIGTRKSGLNYEQICGGMMNYHFVGSNNHGHPTGGSEHPDWTFGKALARAKQVQDRRCQWQEPHPLLSKAGADHMLRLRAEAASYITSGSYL